MTRPVIGITCYVERASRGDWVDQPSAAAALRLRAARRAGRSHRAARAATRRRRRGPGPGGAGPAGRPDPRRGRRRGPQPVRRHAAPERAGAAARPRRARAGAGRGVTRGGATGARHLPRHAGDGGRGRRHPRAARARPGGPRPALARSGGLRGASGAHRPRHAAGPADRRPGGHRELPPPVGARPPRLRRRRRGRTTGRWRRWRTPDAAFRLAVQWHPETGQDARLFEAPRRRLPDERGPYPTTSRDAGSQCGRAVAVFLL